MLAYCQLDSWEQTLGKFNRNSYIFTLENSFKMLSAKMVAILSGGRWAIKMWVYALQESIKNGKPYHNKMINDKIMSTSYGKYFKSILRQMKSILTYRKTGLNWGQATTEARIISSAVQRQLPGYTCTFLYRVITCVKILHRFLHQENSYHTITKLFTHKIRGKILTWCFKGELT